MQTLDQLRSMHHEALRTCADLVATVTPADLDCPTPCAGWDVRALLGHMVGQNHGFAAAVETATAHGDAVNVGADAFVDRPVGIGAPSDIDEVFRASAARLAAAFAAADGAHTILLTEISETLRFRLHDVVGFQLVDTLVHAWDVAVSLGRRVSFSDELVAEGLAQAERVPDGPNRDAPRAAFARSIRRVAADDWERTLLLLGRDPAWTRPMQSFSTVVAGNSLG